MIYEVQFPEKLHKKLKSIPRKSKEQIVTRIERLSVDPRPVDCKKLKGDRSQDLYRVRSGEYRIIYSIYDTKLVVVVVDVGSRKEIYRNF